MKYKLVCIDMDGTLLNSKHKVSEASKAALKKAHDRGVYIVISTGRTYADAEAYSNLIGIKAPIIASNGAIIKEKDKSEVIYKSAIDERLCIKLLNVFKKYNTKPSFNTPYKVYSSNLFLKIFVEFIKWRGIMNKSVRYVYVKSWDSWEKVFREEAGNIIKVELMHRDKDRIKRIREELDNFQEVEIASSLHHNLEITNKGVSKGRALETLAQYYNIKREEIMAIGDSENDLSMIEAAGMGIAMGNATDEVKKRAKYITDTNDNEGVAKVIEKFIMKD